MSHPIAGGRMVECRDWVSSSAQTAIPFEVMIPRSLLIAQLAACKQQTASKAAVDELDSLSHWLVAVRDYVRRVQDGKLLELDKA